MTCPGIPGDEIRESDRRRLPERHIPPPVGWLDLFVPHRTEGIFIFRRSSVCTGAGESQECTGQDGTSRPRRKGACGAANLKSDSGGS